MKIGDTLYYFNVNRRKYRKPEPGRQYGTIIYAEHFEPMEIVGENKVSWLMKYGHKAPKKDPESKGYYTAQGMADNIWAHDHRHKLRDLLDRASPTELREVAKVLGYNADEQLTESKNNG